MKRIRNILLATVVGVSATAGLFACGENGGKTLGARDVYAMAAVSSISYLSEKEASVALLSTSAATRPSYMTDSDAQGIKSCIESFDGVIAGGGIEQEVKANTSTDEAFSGYAYEMAISLPEALGGGLFAMLYFNETSTNTEVEKDGFEEEVEVSTRFEGVAVVGEEIFSLRGEKEVETEGRETETSIEFVTYKDKDNYVVVSQSAEDDEVEYEYAFFENGRKVQELELEYEEERGKVEIEFQIKDLSSGTKRETKYRIRKNTAGDGFVVSFEKNGKRNTLTVVEKANGYEFIYDNGFSEVLS